jgi:hypothetical protein
MQKANKLPHRTSKEWSTLGIKKYALLLLEFLRISPSYTLAHQIRSQSISPAKQKSMVLGLYRNDSKPLTKSQSESLLKDFEKVLKTYD